MRRTLTLGLLLGIGALSAAAREPMVAEDHVGAGLNAYWSLNFQSAQSHFQAAVDADPQSAAAVYYLGYTVYKVAEPKPANDPGKRRAAELFASAYELDPSFVPGWGIAGKR